MVWFGWNLPHYATHWLATRGSGAAPHLTLILLTKTSFDPLLRDQSSLDCLLNRKIPAIFDFKSRLQNKHFKTDRLEYERLLQYLRWAPAPCSTVDWQQVFFSFFHSLEFSLFNVSCSCSRMATFRYYHLKNVIQSIVYLAFDYHLLYRSLGKFQLYKKKDSIVLMQIKCKKSVFYYQCMLG